MYKVEITPISEIIFDIEKAINEKLSFSLMRFCDGFLKIGNDLKSGTNRVLFAQHRKEGIPLNFFDELMKEWAKVANEADYIDAPIHYVLSGLMSRRLEKASSTLRSLIGRWDEIYSHFGIDLNRKFCSPEAGFLSFISGEKNLLDLVKDRNICCLTNFYNIDRKLKLYANSVSIKHIPSFYGNHYDVCFESIMSEIKREACDYHLWLVGAGELGRVYTGEIKRCGGVAVDIGKVFDAWTYRRVDPRLKSIIKFNSKNELLFDKKI